MMAWVCVVLAMLASLTLTVAAALTGSWPLWVLLLMYPAVACMLTLTGLAWLMRRTGGSGTRGARAEPDSGKAP
ncbi:hypothetical protein [Leisingera sp. McT4-56]|uniref:hypothetical protein n=1 Tax=Leisingera sp. McT4-56 TaxID=2881255 RepID=UPI001CF7F841|nr:hypothetical protein [Leisingera sp. McT4-56]MCB4456093.1 hypothetical protein [Leisingera sp. McT4-56]